MKDKGQTGDLEKELGQALVRLARRTIAEKFTRTDVLTGGAFTDNGPGDNLIAPELQEERGTFVTLKINNRLRGCIGSLTGSEPLLANVQRNALNAAFHDPRFAPLSRDELEQVEIEVSILTEARQLSYSDAEDLLAKLRPQEDGVIIQQGPARATFLPQVWEQLPNPADFLSHLCRKAGLPGDAWCSGDLQVSTYQVQYFHENE